MPIDPQGRLQITASNGQELLDELKREMQNLGMTRNDAILAVERNKWALLAAYRDMMKGYNPEVGNYLGRPEGISEHGTNEYTVTFDLSLFTDGGYARDNSQLLALAAQGSLKAGSGVYLIIQAGSRATQAVFLALPQVSPGLSFAGDILEYFENLAEDQQKVFMDWYRSSRAYGLTKSEALAQAWENIEQQRELAQQQQELLNEHGQQMHSSIPSPLPTRPRNPGGSY